MIALSRREKMLLPLLPAAALVLVYGWAIRGGETAAGLRRQIERAKAGAPSVAKVETRRTELRAERDAVETLRARAAQGPAGGGAPPGLSPDSVARMEAEVLLGGFIQENGLLLLEERIVDPRMNPALRLTQNGAAATAPDNAGDDAPPVLAQQIQSGAPPGGRELWELRLAGRFEQMRLFTLRLGEPEWPLFPVALSMETTAAPENPVRIWRLWLWR